MLNTQFVQPSSKVSEDIIQEAKNMIRKYRVIRIKLSNNSAELIRVVIRKSYFKVTSQLLSKSELGMSKVGREFESNIVELVSEFLNLAYANNLLVIATDTNGDNVLPTRMLTENVHKLVDEYYRGSHECQLDVLKTIPGFIGDMMKEMSLSIPCKNGDLQISVKESKVSLSFEPKYDDVNKAIIGVLADEFTISNEECGIAFGIGMISTKTLKSGSVIDGHVYDRGGVEYSYRGQTSNFKFEYN
jgi:hypothetical protein